MDIPEQDYVLEELVQLANDSDLEVSITVLTSGGAISGRLTSNEKWFEAMSQRLSATQSPEDRQADRPGLHMLYQRWQESFAETREENRKAVKALEDAGLPGEYRDAMRQLNSVAFLHLSNARLISGSAVSPASMGMSYRIRLSEVTGWSFGEVSSDS